ncbi:MAG: NAD-dependent epimerase/dehydratase family protein [Austwickia sp.]|nr:NAD-dependent epimerase/dehydratase family protein [Austwickia sp.]MBK8436832.1 NAD-dependent epimerase/dehydratase family protein [Austwickia sp.]MBK9100460.1 NAD-dependent epimerase/dehydratase family protein [Austwickia sp.]
MKAVVTGADGFLGWHLRALLSTLPGWDVVGVGRSRWSPGDLTRAVTGADVVFHLAGINRATEYDVEHGNVALAEQLTDALTEALTGRSVPVVVFAGSTQADLDVPYGRGKRVAGEHLAQWAVSAGGAAADVRLPGLFGEHGRPAYNSFVATFADQVARGQTPQVTGDRDVPLLHVHAAARVLVQVAQARYSGVVEVGAEPVRISEVARLLQEYHATYSPHGDIPALHTPLEVALFNTYRAALWAHRPVIALTPRSDQRGTLVESVRVHGGPGQSFVSSTHPGYVRGEHFHFRKIERFQVIQGRGRIRLRKLFDPISAVQTYDVSGESPCAIDMPTLWTHSIENIGDGDLTTLFWTNELFDPDDPDTHPHPVH